MLPAAIKDARIMRYGYQSQWFGKDALEQNASRIAPSLLDALKRKRKVSEILCDAVYYIVFLLTSFRNPSNVH